MRLRIIALAGAVLLGATGCLATLDNTGPEEGQDVCDITTTGEFIIDDNDAVVDGLCLTDGYVSIRADGVELRNSRITGSPGSPNNFFIPVLVEDGSDDALIHHNVIDCGPADTGTPVATQGIRSPDGLTSGHAHNNEIRDCTDAIEVASDWKYSFNYLHLPDNTDESHADAFQWSTESDGSPIHDVLVEWNTTNWPLGSASFQFHTSGVESEGSFNIVVRYNKFQGGAAVVRIPRFGNGGNEFYGNHVGRLVFDDPGDPDDPHEFFVCTSDVNGTDPIDVWGRETGDTTNSVGDTTVLDDDNVDLETGAILEREDCE